MQQAMKTINTPTHPLAALAAVGLRAALLARAQGALRVAVAAAVEVYAALVLGSCLALALALALGGLGRAAGAVGNVEQYVWR